MQAWRRAWSGTVVLGVWLVGCGPGRAQRTEAPATKGPGLEAFDNGAFQMQVPRGWGMAVAGDCASLAFVLQDPAEPLRKVLYFGMVGPVYQAPMQKQIDQQYMAGGGFPVEWVDMPVVSPLTPENLLANFSEIAGSQVARRFMPGCPRLEQFQAVTVTPQGSPLGMPGARSAVVRGVFVENGRAGQGVFSLTTAPFMPMMGGPGGGTAYGYLLTGITAPSGELEGWLPILKPTLESFRVHPEYLSGCRMRSEAAFAAVAEAGRTLRETSDQIHRSWEARNRTDDILAQKRSDVILGKERLYDPGSGEVYEFENGFGDHYRLNPGEYRNSDLQPLPGDDHGLWTAPARDGYRELGL